MPRLAAIKRALTALIRSSVNGWTTPLIAAATNRLTSCSASSPSKSSSIVLTRPSNSCACRPARRSVSWAKGRRYASSSGGNAGALTAKRGRSPASTAATSSATSKATETCASRVDAPMCGVAMKLGSIRSGLSPGGSFANTSAAAAVRRPACSVSHSANSSTMPPRAVFIKRAVGFISASWGAPIRLRFESTSGT